jgi:hypothetical protein
MLNTWTFRLGCLTALWFLNHLESARADSQTLIELQAGKQAYQGRLLFHTDEELYLLERDGRMQRLKNADISQFRKLDDRFVKASAVEVRTQLQREFGRQFEVIGTGHYLVCGRSEQAQKYASLFEDLYRTFRGYFSVRGFKLTEPEFPLVAILFPDRAAFRAYARGDGVPASPGLQGYYLQDSNRIALFDPGVRSISSHSQFLPSSVPLRSFFPEPPRAGDYEIGSRRWQLPSPSAALRGSETWHGTSESDLHDTIIHEATHQVAFNLGIHSRTAPNPKWVVEGLATVFEAPGIRNAGLQYQASTRVNHERRAWFAAFRKARRIPKSLAAFIAEDNLFASATLDAYSQAWAFTFFLIETRSQAYSQYLQRLAARPPFTPYTAAERIDDFQKSFGNDIILLEAAFLRFMDELPGS